MAEAELKNNYLSLYAQNADWKERVSKDDCEIVKYQNDSSVRIWYNEQSESYCPSLAYCHGGDYAGRKLL